MPKILSAVHTINLDDCKYVQLTKPFVFESDVLKKTGFKDLVIIPIGFVFDFESVPIIRSTSKRAGMCHDYLYREDSYPVVSRKVADKVYLEMMLLRKNSVWRRWIKYFAVRWFAKSFYHQLKVAATYEEVIAS